MGILKFLTDEMCGDINRWLRMLGYDTTSPLNHPNLEGNVPNDDEIIKICLATHRILISKDVEIIKKMSEKSAKISKIEKDFNSKFAIKQLHKKPTYPCILLKSTDLTTNLSKIRDYFDIQLEYDIDKTRCPKCNFKLQKIENPEEFKENIPESVYKYHTEFWKCSNSDCGKIFWKGTHLERIVQTLKSIQKKDIV